MTISCGRLEEGRTLRSAAAPSRVDLADVGRVGVGARRVVRAAEVRVTGEVRRDDGVAEADERVDLMDEVAVHVDAAGSSLLRRAGGGLAAAAVRGDDDRELARRAVCRARERSALE